MKRFLYFIKWNLTDMQPYTKRMFAYFALGIIAEFIINGGMIIAPVLIFIYMTVDLIRRQYGEFKKEKTDILEAIKTNKKV